MKSTQFRLRQSSPTLIGLLLTLLISTAALFIEPRLLPVAVISGPALVGLAFPPQGRRVYREVAVAGLGASAVISVMLFMPVAA